MQKHKGQFFIDVLLFDRLDRQIVGGVKIQFNQEICQCTKIEKSPQSPVFTLSFRPDQL